MLVLVLFLFSFVVVAGATLNTDIGPDSEAQINPHLNEDFDGREFNNGEENIDTTHQTSEEPTPPVTDKLDSQKKADLKNNSNKTATATNGNGHANPAENKTNTSV